jgi:hypothetical protein
MIDCDDCGRQIGSSDEPICVVEETNSLVCREDFERRTGRKPTLDDEELAQ